MPIRKRFLILFLTIFVSLLAVFFLFYLSQKRQKKLILNATVSQQIELVNTAITVKSNQLNQLLNDYTIWDDLIFYISNPNEQWALSNIGTSLESFNLNTVSVYSTGFDLVYNFGSNSNEIFIDSVQKLDVLTDILREGSIHYFCHLPKGVVEVVGSTIHPTLDTNHTSPARGVFIISKYWDGDYLHELSRNTTSHINFSKNLKSEQFKIENDSLIVFKTLYSEDRGVAAVIEFKKSNKALSNYNRIDDFIFIFICIFLTLVVIGFYIVLFYWVRIPLNIISDSLREGDTSQLALLEKNKDEFSQVARLIHVFNQQKLELEAENTHRRQTEEALLKQGNTMKAIAEASNYLLTSENPDTSITGALEIIGRGASIDRIFVHKNEKDFETGIRKVKMAYQWITPAIADQITSTNGYEFELEHREDMWYFPLYKRETLRGITSQFHESLRNLLGSQKIKSIMLMAITDEKDDNFWGVIGFADCVTERIWTGSDESAMKMLANNIRNAVQRMDSQEELRLAVQHAQQADRAKSDFLASMSHEIRTPMNGVFGMTSLLLHTELTPVQREYVEIIETSGDSLLSIINEVLDFSKIESGRLEMENTSFDLRRCIEDVLDLVAPKVLEKRLEIIYYIEPGVNQYIYGDGFRLRQIIVNLVGNAIKFTEVGEIYIHIGIQSKTEEKVVLEFSVKDSGIGIPSDKLTDIFSPFTQADSTTTRKYGGTGLGLAITSRLVNLMHGKIWVESVSGKGSDFRFTIETRFTTQTPDTAGGLKNQPMLAGKKVLVVDDNPTNRMILKLQCEFWGMKTTIADSGKQALEMISGAGINFDIGILDMQMPDMDGIMLAREIRKGFSKEKLPLVMLTSIGYNYQTEEMQSLFAFYVNKPIKHSHLAEILSKVLSPLTASKAATTSIDPELAGLGQKYPFEILVAEDNLINQKMIRNVLNLLGYSCDVVANGLEVITAVKRKHYSLIFMDIQMPEMDGYEATRIIIDHMKKERPLIIAMTANAMQSDREKCMQTGMDDYITKPLKVDDLRKTFQKWGEKQNS